MTTSFTCWLLDSKGVFLLSSTLVSAGWCVVLPGMSISLLIIVGCECAPGQLVCITPVQLAAKLQPGLIISMRFRSDRSCPLSWVVERRSKLADIHTSCVLGFYSDLVEITSFLCFFWTFLLSIWNNQTVSFCVASFLFKKDTVYFFFSKTTPAPVAVSDGFSYRFLNCLSTILILLLFIH